MSVRVLRLLEYTYSDAQFAEEDQARWSVQRTYTPNPHTTIRSATLPPEFLPDPVAPRRATMAVCTVHLPDAIKLADGAPIEISPQRQTPFGGTLCPKCLERFVDNQVTYVVTADSFTEKEAGS